LAEAQGARRRKVPAWAPLLAVIALSAVAGACSNGRVQGPSAETEFLAKRLLPRILQWLNGDQPPLRLAPLVAGRGYDWVCGVRPYDRLDKIEEQIGARLKAYHSDFGLYPKDGGAAFLVVKGDSAHAIWISDGATFFAAKLKKPCVDLRHAQLVRRYTRYVSKPNTLLVSNNEQ
jgi:hypothetical protein